MREDEYMGSGIRGRRLNLIGVVLFTLATRLAYLPNAVMGFDGPEYINALKLDQSFNVPPPGNIGYVLLGKLFTLLGADPILAYGLTGTLISCIAAAYIYMFASLVLVGPFSEPALSSKRNTTHSSEHHSTQSQTIALFTAIATMASPMVWYHGVIMQSYIVWMAALPAIGYYGLRLINERSRKMMIAASLATGLSTILRPDLVIFGGPLLGAALLLAWQRSGWARKGLTWFVGAAAICAACCTVWFAITSHLLGGPANYLAAVHGKNEWHEHFGVGAKGPIEGLARNGVKYLTFMLWGANIALPLAVIGVLLTLRRADRRWHRVLFAAAWVGPSLYFSWIIFMGNAGLIFPALPLVFVAAAAGTIALLGSSRAVWGMGALAAINSLIFVLTPLRYPHDQRQALLNHMFLGYSGGGIRQIYIYQLEDFGIDRSLNNTMKQFMNPESLPKQP